MSDFDDLIQELRDAEVQDSYIERLQKAYDASPLRREKNEAIEQAKQLKDELARYRGNSLGTALKELGITVKPEALNIPADLDPLDREKVIEWAVAASLMEKPAPSAEEQEREAELDGMEQAAAAANGQQRTPSSGVIKPADVEGWPTDKLMRLRQQHPDAFEALKRGEPAQVPNFA